MTHDHPLRLSVRIRLVNLGLLILHAAVVLVLAQRAQSSTNPQQHALNNRLSESVEEPDTLKTVQPDTARVSEAIPPATLSYQTRTSYIPELGSLYLEQQSLQTLHSSRIPWFAYDYLGDLLWTFPGVYVRDLGSVGQYHQLNFAGVDWRGIQVMVDGRRMNDPLTGIYHLNFISPEFIDEVEVSSGPPAAMNEFNASGAIVNAVTKSYDTNRPITKIRYSEGRFGHLYADGVFTQNITPRVNLVAGFQRWNLDGRYSNSDYEAWNIRFKVRWNASHRFNLMVSEQYNNHKLGMNGGVDIVNTSPGDVFDELFATLRNTDSFEKVNRHDLTATAGVRLFEDSTSVTAISLYYSSILREYRDEENQFSSNGIFVKSDHRSSIAGVSIRQTLRATKLGSGLPLRIQIGGNIDRLQVEGSPNVGRQDESQRAVFGRLEFSWSRVGVAAFARLDRYLERTLKAYGFSTTLGLSGWASVTGGLSRSERSPTFQELHWSDSTVTRNTALEPEQHTLAQVDLSVRLGGSIEVGASYSWRQIEDPIVIRSIPGNYIFPSINIRNGGNRIVRTVDARISFSVWKLSFEGSGTYFGQENDGKTLKVLPSWYLAGGLYFRAKVFRDFLDLKAGVRGRYIGEQTGMEFNPETLIYSERTESEFGPYQTVDVVIIGQIGSAYLHLIWENIADEEYMLSPGFPMLGRNVRFGINWAFLD